VAPLRWARWWPDWPRGRSTSATSPSAWRMTTTTTPLVGHTAVSVAIAVLAVTVAVRLVRHGTP
jgi:hypothetical protein